jgi:hypothetical protein
VQGASQQPHKSRWLQLIQLLPVIINHDRCTDKMEMKGTPSPALRLPRTALGSSSSALLAKNTPFTRTLGAANASSNGWSRRAVG